MVYSYVSRVKHLGEIAKVEPIAIYFALFEGRVSAKPIVVSSTTRKKVKGGRTF